eukprot:g1703.t1
MALVPTKFRLAAPWAAGTEPIPAAVASLADRIETESGFAADAALLREALEQQQQQQQQQQKQASPSAVVDVASLFMLDWPGGAFLNHGSYGSSLRCASKAREAWSRRQESQPLRFAELEWVPAMARVQRALATFVGIPEHDADDLVMVPNATYATNAVCRSLLGPGPGPRDAILMLNLGYAAAKKAAMASVAGPANVIFVDVCLPWPAAADADRAHGEALVARIAERLRRAKDEEGWDVRLAVIDHITSMPSVTLPIRGVSAVCRAAGVPLLVDGAHALGNIPIDLEALDVDFYTSNAHKWLCTPKGAAFLYVSKAFQDRVHPVVVSHGGGLGYQAEFAWPGTLDPAAPLSVNTSLRLFEAVGADLIMSSNRSRLDAMTRRLVEAWGTQVIGLGGNCLAAVELPAALADVSPFVIHDRLYEEYLVEAAIGVCKLPVIDAGAGAGAGAAAAAAAGGGGGGGGGGSSSSSQATGAPDPVTTMRKVSFIRISSQAYMKLGDMHRLVKAIEQMVALNCGGVLGGAASIEGKL